MDVQELRVFVIGCPRCGDPVVQKALGKINECADYIGQLQAEVEGLKKEKETQNGLDTKGRD